MITLPFSCKEAYAVLKITVLGLLVTGFLYGILYENMILAFVGGWLLFVGLLMYATEHGNGIESFIKRNIRCKCDE